jgi:hypothetical protein
MWLTLWHALPVNSRARGIHSQNQQCLQCNKKEDIKHTLLKCKWANEVTKLSRKEWIVRNGLKEDTKGLKFSKIILQEDLEPIEATVTAITAYHIWKHRNKHNIEGTERPPTLIVTNDIWTEIERSLLARIKAREEKITWLKHREELDQAIPHEVEEKIKTITKEIINISQLILNKSLPIKWRRQTVEYNIPVEEDPTLLSPEILEEWKEPKSHLWRLISTPQPKGTLNINRNRQLEVLI